MNLENNFLTNERIRSINGADLENIDAENYFPKEVADDSDKLEDSVDQGTVVNNTVMGKYVEGISQAAKFSKV